MNFFQNRKRSITVVGVLVVVCIVVSIIFLNGRKKVVTISCNNNNCPSGCCVENRCQVQGIDIKGYSCMGDNKWRTPEGVVTDIIPDTVVTEVKKQGLSEAPDQISQIPAQPTDILQPTGIAGVDAAKTSLPTGYEYVTRTEDERTAWLNEINQYAPVNPTEVIAKAGSNTDADEIYSGNDYSHPNPVFSWSGELVKEKGIKVIGYMVYFGDSHYSPDFLNEAKFQDSNTYTASELVKGKTYYLMVRVVTNSSNINYKNGYDVKGDGRPARPIFVYKYSQEN